MASLHSSLKKKKRYSGLEKIWSRVVQCYWALISVWLEPIWCRMKRSLHIKTQLADSLSLCLCRLDRAPLISAPYIISLLSGFLFLCRHLFGLFSATFLPNAAGKKEICFHPSHPWQGPGPNVLGGRVAAVTTNCRKVGRWIEVLVVRLQQETLYGSREKL